MTCVFYTSQQLYMTCVTSHDGGRKLELKDQTTCARPRPEWPSRGPTHVGPTQSPSFCSAALGFVSSPRIARLAKTQSAQPLDSYSAISEGDQLCLPVRSTCDSTCGQQWRVVPSKPQAILTISKLAVTMWAIPVWSWKGVTAMGRRLVTSLH